MSDDFDDLIFTNPVFHEKIWGGCRLETEFGIYTRCGLHCAPWAHKTLGTYPSGSVRFSYGYYNNEAEIDSAIEALKSITRA